MRPDDLQRSDGMIDTKVNVSGQSAQKVLGEDQQLAGGAAPLQVAVGLRARRPAGSGRRSRRCSVPSAIAPSTSPARHSSSSRVGRVVHQRRPGEEQRAAGVEPLQVERRHLPARGAEQREHAAPAQRRRATRRRSPCRRRRRRRAPRRRTPSRTAARRCPRPRRSGSPRRRRRAARSPPSRRCRPWRRRARRAALASWTSSCPTPPAAAWTSTSSPSLHRIGRADQVVRRHALQHRRGSDLRGDARRAPGPAGPRRPRPRSPVHRRGPPRSRRHRRRRIRTSASPSARPVPAHSSPSTNGGVAG